jgi:type II secretory pathway component GspD/PulD (secretin)
MKFPAARWCLPAVLALAWAAAPALAAPGTPATDTKKSDSPADKLRKALDQTTDVTIENQGLETAINQLADQAKINVVIDRWTIQNMGIDPNGATVTVKLQNVKIRTALRQMLNQYNLSYVPIGDSIVVTTEDMAVHRQMKQRVSVEVDKEQLGNALKKLARETGTNIILDSKAAKEAETAISLDLDDVPLETAVRLMAEMAGLKPARVGNVLLVTTKAVANELKNEGDLIYRPQPGVVGLEGINFGGAGIGGIIAGGGVVPIQPPIPPAVAPPVVPTDPPAPGVPKEDKKEEKKEGDKPEPKGKDQPDEQPTAPKDKGESKPQPPAPPRP